MNSRLVRENEAFSIEDESNQQKNSEWNIRESRRRKLTIQSNQEQLINRSFNENQRNFKRRFSERTESYKLQNNCPIPHESEEEKKSSEETKEEPEKELDDKKNLVEDDKPKSIEPRKESLAKKDSVNAADYLYFNICGKDVPYFVKWSKFKTFFISTFDSKNKYYLFWLVIGFMSVVYNFFSIPLRECFDIYNDPYDQYWFAFDYISDAVYVLDIILFQHRIQFLNNGIVETKHINCAKNYFKSLKFKFHVIAIIPTDLFVLLTKSHRAALRLTRLFKFQMFFELFDVLDHVAKNGHVVRFIKTMSYIIYLIHFEACGYYLFSKFIGFSTDTFVFTPAPEQYSAYIYCFYWAMKTATSIGNNPPPTIYAEYFFMNIYWLSGIFVFAVLIGQIRDIFDAANANETNYRKKMDTTILYMKNLNLSENIINKVIMWFNYNWEHHKTLDENSLIESLPTKLKSDLAIHTHFNTLSKVSLFQDCERTLLSDLILKLKPVLFLPNDFICKKGEIGTEMYIVMTGQVEVVGGPNNSIVFATLKEGSVFGEISLLALSGGNRRTADVKSKGFSTLFSLSKQDFEEAMADYPAAYELLKDKANKVLNRHKVIEKKEPEKEPESAPAAAPVSIPETKLNSDTHILTPKKEKPKNFRKAVLKVYENQRKENLARDNESYCSTPSEMSINYRDSISITYDTKTPTPTFDRRILSDNDSFYKILIHNCATPTFNHASPSERSKDSSDSSYDRDSKYADFSL